MFSTSPFCLGPRGGAAVKNTTETTTATAAPDQPWAEGWPGAEARGWPNVSPRGENKRRCQCPHSLAAATAQLSLTELLTLLKSSPAASASRWPRSLVSQSSVRDSSGAHTLLRAAVTGAADISYQLSSSSQRFQLSIIQI